MQEVLKHSIAALVFLVILSFMGMAGKLPEQRHACTPKVTEIRFKEQFIVTELCDEWKGRAP